MVQSAVKEAASVSTVHQTLTVRLIKHVVITNALKEKTVSGVTVLLTRSVPAAKRAVIERAKVARIASVNPVWARATAKYWKAAVEVHVNATVCFSSPTCHTFLSRQVHLSFFLLYAQFSSIAVSGGDAY